MPNALIGMLDQNFKFEIMSDLEKIPIYESVDDISLSQVVYQA